jgi:hypothetical protein
VAARGYLWARDERLANDPEAAELLKEYLISALAGSETSFMVERKDLPILAYLVDILQPGYQERKQEYQKVFSAIADQHLEANKATKPKM